MGAIVSLFVALRFYTRTTVVLGLLLGILGLCFWGFTLTGAALRNAAHGRVCVLMRPLPVATSSGTAAHRGLPCGVCCGSNFGAVLSWCRRFCNLFYEPSHTTVGPRTRSSVCNGVLTVVYLPAVRIGSRLSSRTD